MISKLITQPRSTQTPMRFQTFHLALSGLGRYSPLSSSAKPPSQINPPLFGQNEHRTSSKKRLQQPSIQKPMDIDQAKSNALSLSPQNTLSRHSNPSNPPSTYTNPIRPSNPFPQIPVTYKKKERSLQQYRYQFQIGISPN